MEKRDNDDINDANNTNTNTTNPTNTNNNNTNPTTNTTANNTPNNSRLTVALAGCGRVARKHAKAWNQLPDLYQPVALIDQSKEACRSLNQEFGLGLAESDFYTDVASLFAARAGVKTKPDVVALTTPSGTHYSLAKTALEHGSHVFVEKPMTLDLEEARELKNLAQTTHRKIAVGHIYRFFPLVDIIREDIAAGVYGRILAADVVVHWGHDQAYYDSAAWRGTWQQDGGALMNQTVHALDLMVWLLGLKPASVQGTISRLTHVMEAEDYGAALLKMSDGSVCRVEGTTSTPESQHEASFYISTEKAQIRAGLRSGKPYVQVLDNDGKKTGHYWRRTLAVMRQNGFKRQLQAYLNPHTGIYWDLAQAISADRPPRADVNSGLEAVENVLAIYQSALLGGAPVALPLSDFSLREMESYTFE